MQLLCLKRKEQGSPGVGGIMRLAEQHKGPVAREPHLPSSKSAPDAQGEPLAAICASELTLNEPSALPTSVDWTRGRHLTKAPLPGHSLVCNRPPSSSPETWGQVFCMLMQTEKAAVQRGGRTGRQSRRSTSSQARCLGWLCRTWLYPRSLPSPWLEAFLPFGSQKPSHIPPVSLLC